MILLARSGSGSKKSYSHVLEITTIFKETRFDKNNMCANTLSKKPLAAAVWAKPHGAGRIESSPLPSKVGF
jgi:hypothetical protein